jgi:hypothetical protein
MNLLAVHYHDAGQGFTLENIVDSSFSNIYKVAFTACPCYLAYDLFKNRKITPFGKEYHKHMPFGKCSGQ